MAERVRLAPDYDISRIIKGGWQLAGGHGAIDPQQAIRDMFDYYNAGITTFDCADIYTGVEELIGTFLSKLAAERGTKEAQKVQVHTKYVPDRDMLGKLTKRDVENAVHRSRKRLRVEQLDLVQFHWWDFDIDQYVEVGLMLESLRQAGAIRNLGLTNFDAEHVDQMAHAGVKILTNQVQYSVLDRRPEKSLQRYSQEHDISLLCYGGLAGGFIAENYLDKPEPEFEKIYGNRSLVKYKLIIDDLGGWGVFQDVLHKLKEVGANRGLTISETAILYVLGKPQVSGVIVGARNNQYINSIKNIGDKKLTDTEIAEIDNTADAVHLLEGDVYGLERSDQKHAGIMKYNLNTEV